MNQPDDQNNVHHNWPQLMANLVSTQIMVCLWGRGTGKTEGPIADRIYECVRLMPRSLGGIISVTYDKMLVFIIPKLIKAWARYGYIENEHYWVRKFAPQQLKRPMPYLPVSKAEHFIHHWNGAGNQLISMDRKGIGNAGDLDYAVGDEMRFVKKENLDETINAIRGNEDHFGHCHLHGSQLWTSDMPQDQKGSWMLEYKDMVDDQVIANILSVQQRIMELRETLQSIRSPKKRKAAEAAIHKYNADLAELRREEVYVSYASTFDNIHALGLSAIRNLRRTLDDFTWQLSVLNEEIASLPDGFYPLLDKCEQYTATDYRHIDNLGLDSYSGIRRDCRWDIDTRNNAPLMIALDHNKAITCIVVGQLKRLPTGGSKLQIQNCFYVLDPQKIRHVIKLFADYYKYRENRTIHYVYDHNSIGEDSSRDYNFSDDVVKYLNASDFTVIRLYIGKAPYQKAKYQLNYDMMEGQNPKLPTIEFNKNTTEALQISMQRTDVKRGDRKDGFEKNKDPEKLKSFPQEQAPHLSDAFDMLAWAAANPPSAHEHGGAMTG